VYLDHGGTAIPPKSLMERFSALIVNNLCANPHSTSLASQATSKRIESLRLRLLSFFKADPDYFDLIFVANATAGIKLVAETFRDNPQGFWYGYHATAHTSLVGARELASSHKCFQSDDEVEAWISANCESKDADVRPRLFAYPAQSNMNGQRLPLSWIPRIQSVGSSNTYVLLDAAALASTAPVDLGDVQSAPDFLVTSLYKIFGFPDLGVLVVKRSASHVFNNRRYFGGGTVDMAVCEQPSWYARKQGALHEQIEDGSLPIHNILAIECALDTHQELFGTMERIMQHCAVLAQKLYDGLMEMRHHNLHSICEVYTSGQTDYFNYSKQGPVIAFNFLDSNRSYVDLQEVEKLAAIKNIQLRTGTLCNPGGVATALKLTSHEMKHFYSKGYRCGYNQDIVQNRPIGMCRVSIGPENTMQDIDKFLNFAREFFVDHLEPAEMQIETQEDAPYEVESMTVYPLKSCAGWSIPDNTPWLIRDEGLQWDREWCILLAGTGTVLSMKRYPRMALIKPSIDIKEGLLRVSYADLTAKIPPITIPLFAGPIEHSWKDAEVCGDGIQAQVYHSPEITSFFTSAVGVSCHLGRFPPSGIMASQRHSKSSLRLPKREGNGTSQMHVPTQNRLLLSNESPILVISRTSLDRLNEQIKANGNRAVQAEVFRANIVVSQHKTNFYPNQAYAEDNWRMIQIGSRYLELLGPCRRCQMVCINQETGKRNQEPFITLAKTRKFSGRVYFGQHATAIRPKNDMCTPTIAVGDAVIPIS
jgi:molybdenum cofactor sulfurtransferase